MGYPLVMAQDRPRDDVPVLALVLVAAPQRAFPEPRASLNQPATAFGAAVPVVLHEGQDAQFPVNVEGHGSRHHSYRTFSMKIRPPHVDTRQQAARIAPRRALRTGSVCVACIAPMAT